MNHSKGKEIFVLILCLLIGFALRFHAFDQKSFWLDEIHTFNDSRDDLKGQIRFYKENPAFIQAPLFFVLTHLFYPFPRPERDLRIIPLIAGTISIPFFYLLSRSFSSRIALPCTLSLTLMAYHISLSQDGRSYALLMLLGMAGLFFFMKYLQSGRRGFLILVAIFFAILFHTSYSSIPFIILSQMLWLYKPDTQDGKPSLASFSILNGLTFLLCLPWILFVGLNYKGETIVNNPFHTEDPGSIWYILYGVLHDWVPLAPLMIASTVLLILFPLFSKSKRNAVVLLAVFIFPITGLFLFCKLLNIMHFVTSRYFINFLPLFFIALYLSLDAIEAGLGRFRKYLRLTLLFIILFVASNLVILPLYYRSQKSDFMGLVAYLKDHLQEGDNIFVGTTGYVPGILHYFGIRPEHRHHSMLVQRHSEERVEYKKPFVYKNKIFTIYHSKSCCAQYTADGNRLWIVVGKWRAKELKESSPCVLKGYFDGSFLNFNRFPTDASMYLFLWDPKSPGEKGMDIPLE
ncbi:MAG: hypothetical protein A2157_05340 [Deltaproteobacteria bacterium RBG_16_47_11]|nr:MAG: hypothetical protein A2157_05340 [Deltaproteobacteria bacterium RBG_16_47_11]